jgi:sugar lactone lactonase YvrE
MQHKVALASLTGLALVAALGCQKQGPAPRATAAPAGPIVVKGLATPESVLLDPAADVYLVSNINGSPLDKDGNGFISRVSPDGTISQLKWIDGTAQGVTLNGPKGLAIVGDTLYVTDIDAVRMFDRTTGAPKGAVEIPGATFLNDLAPAPDGGVYLTDSGLKAAASGFEPSGSAAIYEVKADGSVRTLLKDPKLPGPNGIAVDGDRVLVAAFGSNELFTIEDGAEKVLAHLPKGSLDGLVKLPDGRWAVSSWEGQAVYAGPLEGPFETILSGVPGPADIGLDPKRSRLLVPSFLDSEVLIQPLPH